MSQLQVAPIAGQLPYGNMQSVMPSPGGTAGNQFASAYNTNYQNALDLNQSLYQNILQGYQQTAAQQGNALSAVAGGYGNLANTIQSQQQAAGGQYAQAGAGQVGMLQGAANQAAQGTQGVLANYGALGQDIGGLNNATLQQQMQGEQGVQAGYGSLNQGVQNTIQGITASQQQAINDAYAQASGSATQQLMGQGLGNTTVAESVQRGLTLDQQKANVALANQQAQLSAGYQAQLGLAGLNYAGQSVAQNAAQQNLNTQNQMSIGQLYGNAMQQGVTQNLGAQQAVAQQYGNVAQNNLAQQNLMAQAYGQNTQAGLQAQYQGALANTGQANQQLGWMNSIQAPLPNTLGYAQAAYSAQQANQAAQAAQTAQQQAALGALGSRGMTVTQGGPSGPVSPPPFQGQVSSYGRAASDGGTGISASMQPATQYNTAPTQYGPSMDLSGLTSYPGYAGANSYYTPNNSAGSAYDTTDLSAAADYGAYA